MRHTARRFLHTTARAFTLLEILVVLAIAGMIIGLAVANFDNIFGGAKEDVAKMFVSSSLKVPLQSYRMHMGDFPSTAEGLQALIIAPADKAERWRGPYLDGDKSTLLDPWGVAYQYNYPGTRNKTGYDVWSNGPDKQSGTADDIGNWATGSATTGQ
ncbi:type II secretion system major pseudopilin GspG [Ereboglobus luteus]|uniref:Type II secretion system protein GspG n=1 Tax=Ereboglobus luteus TaxID=1796921 RepID=A0A2U8E2X3_9BACT|nr:type II secretion system major pseudopilin GspG [Ereboglobus luteus]AWI09228.1 type II secretion system protein GspG [Ereboglobus luteus]